MKKLCLLTVLILSIFGNAQIKIGEIKNDKFIITEDISVIKETWRNLLAKQKINSPLKQWDILSIKNEEGISYLLIATTSDNSTRIACELELKKGIFSMSSDKRTVTCTGCRYGCSPEKIGDLWYCSSGCAYDCTKTETVSSYDTDL